MAGGGTQTSALSSGGADASPTNLTSTEQYNGTTWASTGNLAVARNGLAGDGVDNTSGLVFGGSTPSLTASTEEFTDPLIITRTLTTS